MKRLLPILVPLSLAVVLALGNVYMRQGRNRGAAAPGKVAANGAPMSAEDVGGSMASAKPAKRISLQDVKWESVETTNYLQYVVNLRAIGFPEELIRSIVTADVNAMYASREDPLKPRIVAEDAPEQERRKSPTPADMERIQALRKVAYEKQDLLESMLETHVPRELVRGVGSRNYEAYEYAFSKLPPEKREAAQRIEEEEFYLDDLQKTQDREEADLIEAFRRSHQARVDALRQLLTPEEFEKYNILTAVPGTELARQVIGMEPTEEEFAVMFRLYVKDWEECGGVFGWWRAVEVPQERIRAADEAFQDGLRAALGPDRYLDYQMAMSETGQRLHSLGERYDLGRDTLSEAFRLQREADALARGGGPDTSARLTEIQNQLRTILSPGVWDAWNEGRNITVQLDP